jgi:hypothetical protein
MGLGEIIGDHVVTVTGDGYAQYGYVSAGSAKDSAIIKRLNPPQRFPAVDTKVRAFSAGGVHPTDVGGTELTPEEYYRFILNIDMGGQFYFRENRDTASTYLTGGI